MKTNCLPNVPIFGDVLENKLLFLPYQYNLLFMSYTYELLKCDYCFLEMNLALFRWEITDIVSLFKHVVFSST